MSNPSYILKLGIDEADLARGLNASETGFKDAQEKAKLLSAEIALLEQRMASGKTEEMAGKYKMLTTSLREAREEATAMGRQLKALEAIKPPAVAAADDSARYETHLRNLEQAERGRRAQLAADSTRLAMPAASGPSAAITMAEEAGGAAASQFAISRMGKMELGHVARSLAGSASAGIPLGQSVMMEAPRLLSALGPALAGFLPVIAPVVAALAGFGIALSAHNANREARRQRRENDIVGSESASSSEQYEGVLDADEGQVKKTREARKKRHFWNKILNAGVSKRDEIDAQTQANTAAFGLEDSLRQDADIEQREFDGSPKAARDKLAKERDDRIAAAKAKHRADDEASVHARNALIDKANADYNLGSEKQDRADADRKSGNDASRDINTVRSEGRNVRVEGASIRAREAQEKLEHGAKSGPEHDDNTNRAKTAALDAEDAARTEKNDAASVAAEEKILQIKREGLNVDVRIAQQRLSVAQGLLDNSREKTGAAYDALKLSADNAREEVAQARKATAEKNTQAGLEQRIASLRGSSDQVRQNTLELERKDIARRMAGAAFHPDQMPGLITEATRNAQQRAEFEKQKNLRSIDIADTEDHAHTGRGPEAQAALMQREIDRIGERRDWNKKENGNDAGFNAGLDDKLHELTQAIEDLTFAEQSRMTALQNEQKNINRRGYQATGEEKDSDTDRKYDREKKEAERRGAPQTELDQIAANRRDEHTANAADEVGMSAEDKLKRMRANDARDRAVGTATSTKARHDEATAANEGDFDEFSGAANKRRVATHAMDFAVHTRNRIDEIKAGAANAGKGDANSWKGENIVTAVNSVEKALGGAFKNR